MHKNTNKSREGSAKNVGCLVVIIILFAVGYGIYSAVKDSAPSDAQMTASRARTESIMQSAIPPSIVEMEEVDWVEYDGNEVYVGFNTLPSDVRNLLNAWALQANVALDRGVRVIGVEGAEKGWRPGDPSGRTHMASARHGQIQ